MRLNKLLIYFIVLFATAAQANAQTKADNENTAFSGNEKLTYIVSYKFGATFDLADVVFNVNKENVEDRPTYHINAVARVLSGYKWIFDMRDEYNTWLDHETLRPIKFRNDIKEGSYRFESSMVYDWDNMVVDTKYRNLKRDYYDTKQMKLSASSFDGLALFYNLRNTALEEIKEGYQGYIDLVTADTIERLQYKFLGREEISIPRVGKFKTIKFTCQITNTEEESFAEGSEFTLWLSDDKNKIPLYIESPIRVGSIKGRLSKYQNLKHPLTSKIR